MSIKIISVLLVLIITLCSCSQNSNVAIIGGADDPTSIIISSGENNMYESISADKAKRIMDSDESAVILDVREKDEFDDGHIPGAILIPYDEVAMKAEDIIKDKDTTILIYCRSGRRSKIASQTLVGLGYTNVKEFGGIIDWKYNIEK